MPFPSHNSHHRKTELEHSSKPGFGPPSPAFLHRPGGFSSWGRPGSGPALLDHRCLPQSWPPDPHPSDHPGGPLMRHPAPSPNTGSRVGDSTHALGRYFPDSGDRNLFFADVASLPRDSFNRASPRREGLVPHTGSHGSC